MQAANDRDVRRVLLNSHALYPDGVPPGPRQDFQRKIRFDDDLQQWTAPFLMEAVNTKVVHRTNALADFPYGRDFRYAETVACGSGAKGSVVVVREAVKARG